MRVDKRGGHNNKYFNKNFFKVWTPSMAYVLGFTFADGCLLDARKSSRCCYLKLYNNDLDLLTQIRKVMDSKHTIETRKAKWNDFNGKKYFCKESYGLKVGSKEIFQDLIDLGLRPDKSLAMKMPDIPDQFLGFFLRGYFDGDGCIYVRKNKQGKPIRLATIFVSGSFKFLEVLSKIFFRRFGLPCGAIRSQGAYQLRFRRFASVKILNFMYADLQEAPYLKRKYEKYQEYIKSGIPQL